MLSTLFNTPTNATLHRLAREMDRLFDAESARTPPSRTASPSVNIWKKEDAFILETEIPGFKPEQIDILVQATRSRSRDNAAQACQRARHTCAANA